MCESGMFWQRYWRPSYWAWLQPPSSWGPMSTIATLNFPDSTSGIWRLAPAWVQVPAQFDADAAEPLGAAEPVLAAPEQAPTMTTAAVSKDSSRRRDVTMDSPPRRALGRVRTSGIMRSQARSRRRGRTVPGRDGRSKDNR